MIATAATASMATAELSELSVPPPLALVCRTTIALANKASAAGATAARTRKLTNIAHKVTKAAAIQEMVSPRQRSPAEKWLVPSSPLCGRMAA